MGMYVIILLKIRIYHFIYMCVYRENINTLYEHNIVITVVININIVYTVYIHNVYRFFLNF